MKKLQEVIVNIFAENEPEKKDIANTDFLKLFLDAKKVEGCSERTIKFYRATIEHFMYQIKLLHEKFQLKK